MYLDYHELLKKYKEASQKFYKALDDGSKIATAVMLKSSQYKEIMVNESNSSPDDKLVNYVENRAQLDEIINKTRNDMNILDYYLKKMAIEMKNSSEILDRVYYYKWIEHKKPRQFNRLINYSIPQTYRFIDEIKINIYKHEKK